MSVRLSFLIVLAVFSLAACCETPPAEEPGVDVAAEEQAIRGASIIWLQATQAKDSATINDFFDADAVTIFDGEIHEGLAAIQANREAVRLDPAFRKARENLIEAEAELRQRKEALATDAVRPATRSKGFHMRAGAYIIDVCIQFAINAIMGLVAVIVFSPLLAAGSNQFYNPFPLRFLGSSCLSQALFVFLYFPIFEWLFGASPGKLILGMRVVQEDGRPCTLKAAVIRGLARLVDQLLSANVAFFQMAKTPLRQRYGDKAANTLVVDHKDALIQRLRPWWWFLIAAISYLGLQGILAGLLVKDTLGSGW